MTDVDAVIMSGECSSKSPLMVPGLCVSFAVGQTLCYVKLLSFLRMHKLGTFILKEGGKSYVGL